MAEDIVWLTPWHSAGADDASLVGVLRRELGPGHALESEDGITVLGRRRDTDDVLFGLTDGRVATVHLTWSATREELPEFPTTRIYSSLAAWAEAGMARDHADFDDEDDDDE